VDKRSPNDLGSAVPKFCLALEEFRRTADGRVRTSQEFMQQFFPHDASKVTDRIFKYLPNEVRGPVLTSWGLRGAKSALKDTDEKVQSVVWDALLAGDIDHDAFESAIHSDILVKWAPLPDWWSFWRGGKLSKQAIQKALDSGYELGLFDAKWFFETIESPGGKLKGTDVVSEGLTKAELTEWVRKVHASGDGSPKGLLAALGWERVVGKTPNEVLIKVLDAVAAKVKLVEASKPEPRGPGEKDPSLDTPTASAKEAEAQLMSEVAQVQRARSSIAPGSGPASGKSDGTDELVDRLFSESKIPPAGPEPVTSTGIGAAPARVEPATESKIAAASRVEPDSENFVIVEEDMDMGGTANETPTGRPPPPSAEPEAIPLQKARPSIPSVPAVPSAKRR
jgi:hypothetical protein